MAPKYLNRGWPSPPDGVQIRHPIGLVGTRLKSQASEQSAENSAHLPGEPGTWPSSGKGAFSNGDLVFQIRDFSVLQTLVLQWFVCRSDTLTPAPRWFRLEKHQDTAPIGGSLTPPPAHHPKLDRRQTVPWVRSKLGTPARAVQPGRVRVLLWPLPHQTDNTHMLLRVRCRQNWIHHQNRPQAAHAASKATTTRMPEKRTTGRMVA